VVVVVVVGVVVVLLLLLEEGGAAARRGCAAVQLGCLPACGQINHFNARIPKWPKSFVFRRKPQVARRVRVRLLGYVRALNQSLLKFKKTC
jgi:hypothetical protein